MKKQKSLSTKVSDALIKKGIDMKTRKAAKEAKAMASAAKKKVANATSSAKKKIAKATSSTRKKSK